MSGSLWLMATHCPFCGCQSATLYRETDPKIVESGWWVECDDCDARTAEYDTKEEAVEAWNKRHRSWSLLMEWIEEIYPAKLFDGSSGDIGPQILVKLREINELRKKDN